MDIKVKREIKRLLDQETIVLFRNIKLYVRTAIPGYYASVGNNLQGEEIVYNFTKFSTLVSWLDAREVHSIRIIGYNQRGQGEIKWPQNGIWKD